MFESIFEGLNGAGVRYVVVGGLATVLHGHARLTVDVDLIVDLAPDEAAKAVDTLTQMGPSPRYAASTSTISLEEEGGGTA